MAPDDERDLIEAVVTCEGNLHDPDFSERFQTLVNNLKTVLYTKEEPFKIRKVEPWNSVRVTISIPKEAAQRLRVLAQQGSHVLRQLGILSVQVEGDQVISLTLAGRYNNEPQEVILRPSDAPIPSTPLAAAASSSCSSSSLPSATTVPLPVAAISAAPVAGPSGVTLDILSSSTSSAFRSPNVVAPSGESIPLPPKNASGAPRPPLGGPFPFASMTHAAQAMQRNESSNPLINTANSTNNSPSPSISPAPSGVLSTPSTPNPAVNAVPPVNNNNSIAPVNSSVGASQQTTVTIPVLVQTQTANHTAPVSVGLSVQGVPLTNINLTNVTVKSDQVTRYILNSSSNVNTNAISQASPSQSLQLQLVNVNVPPPYPGVNSSSSSGNNVNNNNNNNNTNSSNHLVHHHHQHHQHLKTQQHAAVNSPRATVTSSSTSSANVTMVGAVAAAAGVSSVSVGQPSSQSSGGKNNGNFITPSEPVRLSGTGTLKSRTVGQVQGEAKSKPSQPPPHAVLKSLLAQGKEPSTHPHTSQAPPQLTSSGKPRQFLINPLTGHLEPMPSESSSESEASEDDDETEVVQPSRGKGSRLLLTAQMRAISNMHNLPPNLQMSDTAKAIASIESAQSSLMQKINASLNPQRIVRPGSPASSSGRKSRDESLNPSLSAKDMLKEKDTSPVVVNSVPGEKIKLRLKLEKSEPVMSSAYKVEFMKKSEKSSLSSSGGGLSSSHSSSCGGTSPAPGEQPRVPPLHISLRGKNAAVVVSPRREDKDKDFSKSMLEQSLGTCPSSVSSEKLMNSFKLQNTKRIKSRLKSSDSTNSNDSDKFSGSSKKATKISRPRLSKDNSSGSSWSESTSSVLGGNLDGISEDPLKTRLYNSEDKTLVSSHTIQSQNQTVDCNHASTVVDKVSNLPSKVQPGGLVDLISGNSSMTNTIGKVKKSRRKSELLSSRTADNLSSSSSTLPLNVTSQSAEIAHAQGSQLMKHLSQSQSAVMNDFPVHETNSGNANAKTPPTPISCDIDSKEASKVPEKVSVSTSTPGGLVPSGTPSTLIAKDSLHNAPKGTPKPPDIPKLHKGPVPKELEIMSAQVNTVIPEAKVSKSPKPMPELLALPLSSPDKSTDHSHFSISSNPHHPLTQFHHQTPQSKEPKSSHPAGTPGISTSAGSSPTANSAILSRSLMMTEMVNAALRTSQSPVTPSLLSQQQSQSQQSSQSQLLNKLLSDRQKHKEKDAIPPTSPFVSSASALPLLREKERDQSSKQTTTPGVSISSVSSAPPTTSTSTSSNLSNRVKGNTPTILRSRVQSSSSPRISTGTSTDKEQTPVPMPTLTPSPALKSLLEKRKQQIPSSSILPLPPIQISTSTSTQSQKSSQETVEEMEAEVAKVQKRLNQIGGVEIEVRKVSTEDVTVPNKSLRDKVEVEVQLCVSSSPPAACDPKGEREAGSSNNPNNPLIPPSSLDPSTSTSALRSELVTMGAPVLDGSGGSSSSGNTNIHANALSLPLAVALPPITKAEDPSGAPGEDSGIDSMDALSEKSPNQGESPARKESDQFCDSSSVTTTKSSHFVDTTHTNIIVSSNCNNISSIDAADPLPPNLLLQPAERELESDLDKELADEKTNENENDADLTITSSSIRPPTPMESIQEKDVDMEEASVNVNDREEGVSDGIVQRVDSPVRNQVPCESIDITMNKNQSMQMEEMPTNLTPSTSTETQIPTMEVDTISSSELLAQTTVLPEPEPAQTPTTPNTPTTPIPSKAEIPAMPMPAIIEAPEDTQTQTIKLLETTSTNKTPESVQLKEMSQPMLINKEAEPTPTDNVQETTHTEMIQEPTLKETTESTQNTVPESTIITQPESKQIPVPELIQISVSESKQIISPPELTSITIPESTNITLPESTNITLPESTNITKPDSTNVTKPDSTNIKKPESTNITISESTKIALLESSKISVPESSKITVPESSKITVPESSKITVSESSKITVPESSKITVPESSKIAVPESSKIAVPESSKIAVQESSKIAVQESSKIAVPEPSKIAVQESSKIAVPEPSKIAVQESSKIAVPESSKIAVPESSKIAVPESTKTLVPESIQIVVPESTEIAISGAAQITLPELTIISAQELIQATIQDSKASAITISTEITSPEQTKISKTPEPSQITVQESTNVLKSSEPTVIAELTTAPVPPKTSAEEHENKDGPDYSNAVEGALTVLEKFDDEKSNSKLVIEKKNITKSINPSAAPKADHVPLPHIIEAVALKKEVSSDIPIPAAPKVLSGTPTITKKPQILKPKEIVSNATSSKDVNSPVKAPVKEKPVVEVVVKDTGSIVKPQNETVKSVKVEIVSESSRFTKSPIKLQTVKCDVEKVTTPTQTEIKGVPRHYSIITPRPYVSVVEQKPEVKESISAPVVHVKPKGTIVIEAKKPQKCENPIMKDNSSTVTVNSSEKMEPTVVDLECDTVSPSSQPLLPGIALPSQSCGSELKGVSGQQKDDRSSPLEKAGASALAGDKPVKLGIEAITAALKGRAAASLMQPKVNAVVQTQTAVVLKTTLPVPTPTLALQPKQVQINVPKEPVVKVEKEIQTAKYVPMRKQMEMLEAQKAALASQSAQRAGVSASNEVKKIVSDAGIKIPSSPNKDGPVKEVGEKKQVPPEVGKLEKLDVPIVQVTKAKAASTPPPPLLESVKVEQCKSGVIKDLSNSQPLANKSKEDAGIPVAKEEIAEITTVKKVEEGSKGVNANRVGHNSSSGRVMPTQANPMPKAEETIGTAEKSEDKCEAKSGKPMELAGPTVSTATENLPKEIEEKESEIVKPSERIAQPLGLPSSLPHLITEVKNPIVANPNVTVETEKEKMIIPPMPTTKKSEGGKEEGLVKTTLEAKQSEVIETDGTEKKKEKASPRVKESQAEEFERVPVQIIEARASFNLQVSAGAEVDELKSQSQLARKNNSSMQPTPLHNPTKDIKLDGAVKMTPRTGETPVEKKSANALSNVLPENASSTQPTTRSHFKELSSTPKESVKDVTENVSSKIKTPLAEPSDHPPALVPAVSKNPPTISLASAHHQHGSKSISCSPPKLHKAEPVHINLSAESGHSSNRIFQDKPPKLSKATETDRPVVVSAIIPEQRKVEEREKERPKTELKTQMNLIAPGGNIQFQSLNANQSINLARTLPNMIQLSKATTATLATGIGKIPIVSASSQCATTKVTPMVTLGSISVPIQGGSTTTAAGTGHQTVFAIHPNVSLPANISQHLQHHHSRSVTLIPPNPNMLPIKLVTLPKQTQTQLQSIPNLNRSSPLLEAVNIVTNTSGRAGSPNPKGSPVQNTSLNLGSVSVPGSNIHLVPISVASAAGGTASPVKVLVSPVKMMPQMLLKSVTQMMANPQTTIRMVRPDLRPQIQVQQEVKKVETAPPQKSEPAKVPEKDNSSNVKKDTPSTKSSTSDSIYEDVDGVEILDTGSPGANEEDLPFEADIIHDEKDLADVLAGEIIDTDVMENGMSCLDGPYDFGKDGEDSPGRRESVDSPDFQRFSASSKGFKSSWHSTSANKEDTKGHLNSMPDSPIPVMRSSSPLYTYSNSNRSARNSRSRSPSPPEPDVHGEDQEIIDCLSRSPSQPKLSPQNKQPPILERENNEYGSPVKPDLTADHTYMANSKASAPAGDSKGKLDQLSIEIPPVDSPASAHQAAEERKSTRSTRSNTRLVSPDITAFRSDTPKPQKFTSKPDASLLKNSPKPSPTGSLKMISPTVVGTPSSSTRNSPVSNQLLISTPATTAVANSSSRAKIPVTNKRKRQESDSSSASKDENMEEKSEIDLNSRPGKRKCSENAAELIKACIGVEDTPKRNSSLIKKMEESKGKDLKGKMAMMTVVEETEDQLDLLLGDPTLRSRGGRSSRGSSEDRSSSRGSSVHRNTVPSRAVTKDEEQRDVKTNSRVNNRVKDNATKSKSSSGNESPHVNSTPQNKKSAGRRSNRSALAKEKSPLTPAKTRTNVRKDPVVISGASTDKSSTPSTSPENENPRRKTRSSVAVGMPDSDMQSFKRRRISKDTKS